MNEPLICYDVTITVNRDGGRFPNPSEFAAATTQAAEARSASTMSAHMAEKIISVVTVPAASRPAAVALWCGWRTGGLEFAGALACPDRAVASG
jgi:hypothetical protein